MTTPVITVGPDTTFADIVHILLTRNISGVPVVDDGGHLLGIVTEADLVSNEAYGYHRRRALGVIADFIHGRDPQWVRKSTGRTAQDLMTPAPTTVSPDDDLTTAARLMLEGHHKRLPVVTDGEVVGIVSRPDLLRPFRRGDAAIRADIEATLSHPFRAPEGHNARVTITDGVVTLDGTVRYPADMEVLEAVVAKVPGVVAVENRLRPREQEPRVGSVFDPYS